MTDDNPKWVSRGRLSGAKRGRLGRLLDMMYKPHELAEEIGFSVKQFYRVYFQMGCPSVNDETGHRWVNGKAFREWFNQTYKKITIADGEAFCLTCKKGVPIVDPVKERKGRAIYLLSDCPYCGRRRLARIVHKVTL